MKLPSIAEVAAAISIEPQHWHGHCHEVSIAVVRSGLLGEPGPSCRVVRGSAPGYGIGGQHSWVCLGTPYEPDALYVDYTAHTWGRIEEVVAVEAFTSWIDFELGKPAHVIQGYNPQPIWTFGRPPQAAPGEEIFELDTSGLSDGARGFVELLGPMTEEGFAALCTYPQGAWPYREIVTACVEQSRYVRVRLPIDTVGMATDFNPDRLYW